MPGTSTFDMTPWLPAIATVTSGILAGAVALGVTWMNHVFTHRRETAKATAELAAARVDRLREKLEELVALASEHQAFRNAEGLRIATMGVHAANGLSAADQVANPSGALALDRARAIVSLYFPELDAPMRTIEAGTSSHLEFVGEELGLLIRDAAAWQMESRATFGRRSAQAMGDVVRGNAELAHAARAWIEKHYP